ncbi:MAG: hypothetical protein ACTSPW_19355 [Promethearchaeota archaeon]
MCYTAHIMKIYKRLIVTKLVAGNIDIHEIITKLFNVRLNSFIARRHPTGKIWSKVLTGGLYDIIRRERDPYYRYCLFLEDYRSDIFYRFKGNKDDGITIEELKEALSPLIKFYVDVIKNLRPYKEELQKNLFDELIFPLENFFNEIDEKYNLNNWCNEQIELEKNNYDLMLKSKQKKYYVQKEYPSTELVRRNSFVSNVEKSKISEKYTSSDEPNIEHPNNKISKLKRWFFRKKYLYGKFDVENSAINVGIIAGLSLIFWFIYSNSEKINNIDTGILKIGGVTQLVLVLLIARSLYKIFKNLKYGFTRLPNGYKLIAMVLLILFCFYIYQNPSIVVAPLAEFDYNSFNPIDNNGTLESKTNIKNPSYAEMVNFVMEDKTELNRWSYPDYVCEDFSRDVVKNAATKNIRAGLVHLESPDSPGHAIVAFKTTDKGLYFLEPQTDEIFSKAELDKMVEEGTYYPAPGGYYAEGIYWGSWTLSGYHIVYWNTGINIPSFGIVLFVVAVIMIVIIRRNKR